MRKIGGGEVGPYEMLWKGNRDDWGWTGLGQERGKEGAEKREQRHLNLKPGKCVKKCECVKEEGEVPEPHLRRDKLMVFVFTCHHPQWKGRRREAQAILPQ